MTGANILEKSYYHWLKKEITFEDIEDGYVAITTPFIDSNYDNISLFASFNNENSITISDFGFTLFNLEEAGITINKRSKTVWNIFESTLKGFGVSYENSSLMITTSLDKFPIAKTRLLNAIMRLNDLIYLSNDNVTSSFNDLIIDYLHGNEVLYTPDIEIPSGKGISSHFDFSIPTKLGGEQLVKTCGRPNDINQAKVFNFDVKQSSTVRDASYLFLVNDYTHKTNISNEMNSVSLVGIEDKAKLAGFSAIKSGELMLAN